MRTALLTLVTAARVATATPDDGGAATTARTVPDYHHDARPVLERRCVVCHGCYDAPCQLKLEAHAGVLRGATQTPVYDGTRLAEATPSRLHVDATSAAAWRKRGFHPVIHPRIADAETTLAEGLMARMLTLRKTHPLPAGPLLPASFDFSRERSQVCPAAEDFDDYAAEHPLWSMPFGLPDLPPAEYDLLRDWLAAGAPAGTAPVLPARLVEQVASWERFFNGESPKQRLVARYLYEHLFLAHLYLEDAGTDTAWFRLVRSSTPPGVPVRIIATRRPFDDPGPATFYYRLWHDPDSVVDKTHLPYALDAARRARWQAWFLDADYTVNELPGYAAETAANPFVTFQALPLDARHRFLLDEAQFTIMNFIKGPVCRGSVALNVIQDRFWVFFSAPGFLDQRAYADFLAAQKDHLELPASGGSELWSGVHWARYARAQQTYLRAKLAFIRSQRETFDRGRIEVVWDGGGDNPNAALTVFRHHDSASVVRGLVGTPPKTAWVIDYPTLERIHYLLVAGFDVFGSAAHQAMTRLYMDFLRMESEMNFLAFLPPGVRQDEITWWYRDAVEAVRDYVSVYFTHDVIAPLYDYHTTDPRRELFAALAARVAPALGANRYTLDRAAFDDAQNAALDTLGQIVGQAAAVLPETSLVHLRGHGTLTLLVDRAYSNISSMFDEADRRRPAEDAVTVVEGVLGAYPNAFFELSRDELPGFAAAVAALGDEDGYRALRARYGVARTSARFWPLSDAVYAEQRARVPLEAGILDYNRLENR
ncbi:MAG: fatty acid cis/trans isomerase [Gammaproteobacteria bacterium]|nr:fatty acid cis/trans isomerase [Gammaproteobacteria bacterium]